MPQYAVSVVLEQAGFGAEAAAPAARRMFDYLLGLEPLPRREPFSDPDPIVLPPLLDDAGQSNRRARATHR